MKHCPKCGQDKPLEAFGPSRQHKDGHRSECYECRRRISAIERAHRIGGNYVKLPMAMALASSRVCSKCGIEKPVEDFRADPRYRGGYHRICRVCERPYQAKHRNTPEFRAKVRADRASGKTLAAERRKKLRANYGISDTDYAAMFASQNGQCAICGKDAEPSARNAQISILYVDHCHRTGRVRALLCRGCNNGLGCFSDSPLIMERAIAYIRSYQESEA